MKKYVIITPSIINMGGAQMYIRNKCLYMQEKGWIVDVISSQKGKIYIAELRQYNCFIPELGFDYYLYSKKKRKSVITRILNRILDRDYDNIVIESTCIQACTWAEVIAECCNAQHIAYLLQEQNTLTSDTLREFFRFKLLRHELAGITDQSVSDMFAAFNPVSAELSKDCHLPAFCNNVVEDIDSEWIPIIRKEKYNFLVGCLSRLDKPFVIPSLKNFINFTNTHKDSNFLLVMMGGAPNGLEVAENIKSLFKGVKNVELLITGYLFPISTRLLEMFDVFFSSAGSSWVCMRSGVPTITIDGNDFKPIGILGYTTKHSLFRDDKELPLDFNSLLHEILFTKSIVRKPACHEMNNPDFSSHDIFIDKMNREKRYFSFENAKTTTQGKILSIMLSLFGPVKYTQLSLLKNNLLNKISNK